MKQGVRIGDEITSRKGGTFKVLGINQNGSYYCCFLKNLGGESVRRYQHGKTYAEMVTCDIWNYEVTEISKSIK